MFPTRKLVRALVHVLWPVLAVGSVLVANPTGPRVRRATAVELEGDPAAAMAIARSRSGHGYWTVDADGRVHPFGDAPGLGSAPAHLAQPVVGIAPTPSDAGYWLVAADGGVFSFGDAAFHGSTGAMRLNQPIVGMASTPTGLGYWLVASDGGIFTFGDARFMGSTGAAPLATPVTSVAATLTGDGYWLVSTDGTVVPFGGASNVGSARAPTGSGPVVGLAPTVSGAGYWVLRAEGTISNIGDAPPLGQYPPQARRGSLPVGGRMIAASDPTRPTPARGSVPGHPGRDLPTLVYYPAAANGGSTPALRGPWPLVVFAHGFDSTPVDYGALLQPWAAAGYVVAAPYLPGARSDTPGPPTEADIDQEPADLSTVVSAVLASAGQGSWLAGVVDGSRVAAAGHSDGGCAVAAMTLNSGYHDSRINAGVILAGSEIGMPGGTYGTTSNVPVFIGQGTADDINAPADSAALYGDAQRSRVYVAALGGGHETSFTGSGAQPDTMRAATVDFLDWVFGAGRPALARLARDSDAPGLTAVASDLG